MHTSIYDQGAKECLKTNSELNIIGVKRPHLRKDTLRRKQSCPEFKETRVLKIVLRRLEEENVAELIKKASANDHRKSFRLKKQKLNKKKKRKKCFRNRNLMLICKKTICKNVKLKCRKCCKKFKNQTRLDEHTVSNCDTEKVFGCDICGRKFNLKRYLKDHKTPFCHSLRTYKCNICQKQFKEPRSLRNHMTVHGEGLQPKMFLCDMCGMTVKGRNSNFQDHLRLHTGEKPFSCPECYKVFRTRKLMADHKKRHSDKKSLTCAQCGKGFCFKENLIRHMNVHGMLKLKHKCKICSKLFYARKELNTHLKIHIVEKQFECNICQCLFTNQMDQKQHVRLVHSTDKPYTCIKCGVSFGCIRSMKRHLRNVHDPSKSYTCNVCVMNFTCRQSLREHSRVFHAVSKSHTCNICGASFMRSQSLRRHLKTHSDKKLYSCVICGKRFKFFHQLKLHMTMHSSPIILPYQCVFCQKSFTTASFLNDHVKTHDVICDFLCKHCGKMFTSGQELTKHIEQHKTLKDLNQVLPMDSSNGNPVIKLEDVKSDEIPKKTTLVKPSQDKFEDNHYNVENASKFSSFRETNNQLTNKTTQNVINIEFDQKPFLCQICGMFFTALNDLEAHSQTHPFKVEEGTYCDKEEITLNSDLTQKITGTKPKIHKTHFLTNSLTKIKTCKICNKTYSSQGSLIRHMNGSHSNVSHVCNVCNKALISRYNLKRHMLNVHKTDLSGAKVVHPSKNQISYVCKTCNQSYCKLYSLKKHIVSKHNVDASSGDLKDLIKFEPKEKLQNCKKCGEVLDSYQNLLQHENLCNLKFISLSGWTKSQTDFQTFSCVVCGSSFKTLEALSHHKIIHEPAAVASYTIFSNNDEAMLIKEDPAEDKPLTYKQYEPKFPQLTDLNNQIKSHLLDPFKCGICKSSFTNLADLRQHIALTHNNIAFSDDQDCDELAVSTVETVHNEIPSEEFVKIDHSQKENKVLIPSSFECEQKKDLLDVDSVLRQLSGETEIKLEAAVEISFNNF